jgi:hypothetical protein
MTYRPNPEEELMLLLSVLTPPEENTEKVRKILEGRVDFEKLIGIVADIMESLLLFIKTCTAIRMYPTPYVTASAGITSKPPKATSFMTVRCCESYSC